MLLPLLKLLVIWVLIIPLAILNGGLREKVLVPALGVGTAQPLSGLLLTALIGGLTWLALPRLGPLPAGQYALMGALWVVLTVGFEFGFGRLVAHKSWAELLRAYDLSTGNLWSAVLVALLVMPYAVAHLRGLVR